jgi:hypothetical protein
MLVPVCVCADLDDKSDTTNHTQNKDEDVNEENNIEFPDVFYCPITKKLLEDLVVIPAGRMTYE